MNSQFPDSLVEGYEDLVPALRNDEKDRHVLACAVRCSAHAIVTDNTRDFAAEALAPYGIECITADQFIERQHHINTDLFIRVLRRQADVIGWSLPELVSRHVPSLRRLIR